MATSDWSWKNSSCILHMKRLFAFGCSFTNYVWPTWADIMAQDFDYFENWGRTGAGNHFILYSLAEAIQRCRINEHDTVAVMFTSPAREDRWIKGHWLTPGSVYNSSLSDDYIQNYTDPDGFVITNTAVVESVIRIIQALNCKHVLMSTVPAVMIDHAVWNPIRLKATDSIETEIALLYGSTLDKIKGSMYELIFNNNWRSREQVIIPWARERAMKDLQKKYLECAGVDWPTFEDFVAGNVQQVSAHILHEIDQQFGFNGWLHNINTKRQDFHPTPSEHMKYLETIGQQLSQPQKDFAHYWNQQILNNKTISWFSKQVNRF